jgi:hypothetical protein
MKKLVLIWDYEQLKEIQGLDKFNIIELKDILSDFDDVVDRQFVKWKRGKE